nr:MAG TPA: hypothetical protein [Bacteriophage sp.]
MPLSSSSCGFIFSSLCLLLFSIALALAMF